MGAQRAQNAIGRIERALARIEAAARPGPAAQSGDGADPALAAAHARLRGRVEAAIGEIDALLATAEQA